MLITLSYSKHIILIEGAFNERYHWSTVQAYRKCFAFCQSRMISFQKKKKNMKKGRHLNVVLKILFLIGATSKHFQNCHTPPLFSPEPIEMPYLNSNAPNKYFASKYHHDQHYPGEYGNHESNRMVNSNSFDYYPKVQVRL